MSSHNGVTHCDAIEIRDKLKKKYFVRIYFNKSQSCSSKNRYFVYGMKKE